MALHNRKLSFTTPIVVGFAGILLSFMLIAIFVTLAQQKDFLEDYHDINRNFTHNLAINYTETLLRENDFILGRAAAFFARNDELNRAVNVEPEKGLTTLMQLQNMMPSVSSISLADTEGHYLRAPEVLENEDSRAFDPRTRPWFVIFRVDNATLVNLTRHETNLVIGGFTLAAIIIILFGLYLRHASRTVLMNIINAIKTGDVKRAPRLEAMLSKAIETNKQRELSYVRQATIDALTGCKNRRAFDSDIAALMNDHQPFALALVDIDNFKSINDTWGHLNGDIVLRNVAREGLQVLQPLEISLYRYGGEEFAVVFPAEHIDNARTLLETWRVNVERRTWREDGLTVTFSAGLGEWNMEPLDKLVVSVDEALYKAKQQGKNRILRA
ncbi:GGDEF domain-containing protein [Klebsiella pneumoniae]|uniref:GGDEF domain-containing protein n=1 Tax=Klebsiella pneumoniae TaxID=573 RepID=UPI0031316B95